MLYTQEALGTILSIKTLSEIHKDRIEGIFNTVFQFEQKYSRFISGNYLSLLNSTGHAVIDEEFRTIIRASQLVHTSTNGYFDITLLPRLENLGYGISPNTHTEVFGMEHIIIEGNTVSLNNGVQLDLGGVGKGYLIDKIYAQLDQECESLVIDFGGDIKVKGRHLIGLEDPLDSQKIIGEIVLENASLCASSGQKRKFGKSHHLINPQTMQSQNETTAVFTTHSLATFADMYATALFVSPLDVSIEILEKVPGLNALIIGANGDIHKSVDFRSTIF